MAGVLNLIARQDARHRLALAFLAAAIVFFSMRGHVRFSTNSIASWDTFACCVLVLAWLTILTTPVYKLRGRAREQDVGRLVIFVFVVIAACAALFAVGFLLSVNKAELHGGRLTTHLILALITVIFSWSIVHTVFGLRYAHTFYGDSDDPKQEQHAGGLIFPGEHIPNYFDFAYFSFVIGMTCQVSDVQITSRPMRRLALLHSVLSFGFNTVILALLINTVSSLL